MKRAELIALAWAYECEGLNLAKAGVGRIGMTESAAHNFAVANALRALAEQVQDDPPAV